MPGACSFSHPYRSHRVDVLFFLTFNRLHFNHIQLKCFSSIRMYYLHLKCTRARLSVYFRHVFPFILVPFSRSPCSKCTKEDGKIRERITTFEFSLTLWACVCVCVCVDCRLWFLQLDSRSERTLALKRTHRRSTEWFNLFNTCFYLFHTTCRSFQDEVHSLKRATLVLFGCIGSVDYEGFPPYTQTIYVKKGI